MNLMQHLQNRRVAPTNLVDITVHQVVKTAMCLADAGIGNMILFEFTMDELMEYITADWIDRTSDIAQVLSALEAEGFTFRHCIMVNSNGLAFPQIIISWE